MNGITFAIAKERRKKNLPLNASAVTKDGSVVSLANFGKKKVRSFHSSSLELNKSKTKIPKRCASDSYSATLSQFSFLFY